MIVFMLLWILASGGLAYFYVTEWHELLMSFCVIEGHTFKEFVMYGGVLHIGLLLFVLWGICLLLILPKQILACADCEEGASIYGFFLFLLFWGGIVAAICLANRYLLEPDNGWFWKILTYIIVAIPTIIALSPLLLGMGLEPSVDDEGLSIGGFIGALIVLFLLCLCLVFLGFAVVWVFVSHPFWAILLAIFGLLVIFGGGGTVTFLVIGVISD